MDRETRSTGLSKTLRASIRATREPASCASFSSWSRLDRYYVPLTSWRVPAFEVSQNRRSPRPSRYRGSATVIFVSPSVSSSQISRSRVAGTSTATPRVDGPGGSPAPGAGHSCGQQCGR